MDFRKARKAIRTVAKQEGKSEREVVAEIEATIAEAVDNARKMSTYEVERNSM